LRLALVLVLGLGLIEKRVSEGALTAPLQSAVTVLRLTRLLLLVGMIWFRQGAEL
jgi:hypothetical protein